ncbi:MAG: winged helix-turn-helix transcriptional regulator, partial [Nonomuraea sp.]|nr:winged helix-turn-helix transcriptional regulator [Nonomuraea sp.]
GQVLFGFVRFWARRAGDPEAGEQGRLVQCVEAVHALAGRGASATVNAVARELGIDQSGASRLVKNAAQAGYLTLRTSGADGRHRHAGLTDAGRTLLDQAHHWQEQVFDRLTTGWSDRRRDDFRRAMADLMESSQTL